MWTQLTTVTKINKETTIEYLVALCAASVEALF